MLKMVPRLPKIRVLMSIPCAQVGVGMTCRSVLAARGPRVDATLYTSAFEGQPHAALKVKTALPRLLSRLPFELLRPLAYRRLHRAYLDSLQDGDIAYLWPSCPISVYEAVAARGVTIVGESVNTRMEKAKAVLDAAYAELGLPATHPITEARVAEQNRRHALCTAIFTPSPATEAAFAGTPMADRLIPASYGTWMPKALPDRPERPKGAPVTFLFVGSAGVRKGMHLLLRAWRLAPQGALLRIVGQIEPALGAMFADVLNGANVTTLGFSHDVAAEYARADVALLPSLEEGDPIVTYEAAAHGLPMIASQIGAGRIGAETGAITVVDPTDTEAFGDVIAAFTASEELRRHKGQGARTAALGYDWSIVAPKRFNRLAAFLEGRGILADV